jgi:hypothetical protein
MVNELAATPAPAIHPASTTTHRRSGLRIGEQPPLDQQPSNHPSHKGSPSILVVAAKWWSLSPRLAMALLRHGCRVSALCPTGHPLRRVSGLERIDRYAGIRSLTSLARILESARPDIVVPCDDGVVAQLHRLHAERPPLREVIERSLGDPRSFHIVRSRHRLLQTASKLGITVPETRRVTSMQQIQHWHESVARAGVLKIDGESGGNGVRFCTSIEESSAAWQEFNRPQGFATGCKRLIIDRNPLALWQGLHGGIPDVTLQRIVRGRPANCMAACLNGEVISVVSVEVLAADGPTGAATIVRRIHDPRMERAATLIARELHLSGFFGLDFMLETDTRTPYLIEMNPRCTQLGHLEFADQGSLAGAFTAQFCGNPPPAPQTPAPSDTIALFPQGMKALRGGSVYRDEAYLDVPRDEPLLIAELEKDPWPQRRWAARLYHALRPIQRTASIEYEKVGGPALRGQARPHRA